MTKLLGLFEIGYLAAVLLAAALGFGVVQTLRLSSAKVSIAGLERDAAVSAARVATLTKNASEFARKVEADRASAMVANVKEIAREKLEYEKREAAFVADADAGFDRLRIAVNGLAGRTGAGAVGTLAGLSFAERAARLGSVLVRTEEATRRAELADAQRLEALASQVRGLQRAYAALQDGRKPSPLMEGSFWGATGDHP